MGKLGSQGWQLEGCRRRCRGYQLFHHDDDEALVTKLVTGRKWPVSLFWKLGAGSRDTQVDQHAPHGYLQRKTPEVK